MERRPITVDLSRIQLSYVLEALRTLSRQSCNTRNCGEVCLCGSCAARAVLPVFDDLGNVSWAMRAEAAIQRIADEQYDEAIEILRCEADEYVDFVYGDRNLNSVY
jgi:hypothetical protein